MSRLAVVADQPRGSGAVEGDRYPDERRMVGEPRGRARVRWHELLAGLDVVERGRRRRRSHLHHRRQSPSGSRYLLRVPVGCTLRRARPRGAGRRRRRGRAPRGAHAAARGPSGSGRERPAALGPAAARLYGDPSRAMRCLGITGTAGKSTTAALLDGIAHAAGEPTGLIGNDGVFVDGALRSRSRSGAARTCPRPISSSICSRRCVTTACAPWRWKSRRALDFGRVDATWFAAACFTNLSHEHLDDHGSLEALLPSQARALRPGARRDRRHQHRRSPWCAGPRPCQELGPRRVDVRGRRRARRHRRHRRRARRPWHRADRRRPSFGCRRPGRVAAHRRVQRREPSRRHRHGACRRLCRWTR